jgi:hypothetical protein
MPEFKNGSATRPGPGVCLRKRRLEVRGLSLVHRVLLRRGGPQMGDGNVNKREQRPQSRHTLGLNPRPAHHSHAVAVGLGYALVGPDRRHRRMARLATTRDRQEAP